MASGAPAWAARWEALDVARLNAGTAANLDAVRSYLAASASAAVPSCPDWTVRDLATHVADAVGWGYYTILSTPPDEITLEALYDLPGQGEDQADLDYFDECVAKWQALLSDLDPDAPTMGLLGFPVPARVWLQRAALETTIHLWDAQTSDSNHTPFDPVLCLYGIEEVLYDNYRRSVAMGSPRPSAPLEVTATDTGQTWRVCVDGNETTLEGCAEPAAIIRATADDLNLVLWGRLSLQQVVTDGPEELLDSWLGLGSFAQDPNS